MKVKRNSENNNGEGLIGGVLEQHAFHYLAERVGISSNLYTTD
jgi:hypothetical protein